MQAPHRFDTCAQMYLNFVTSGHDYVILYMYCSRAGRHAETMHVIFLHDIAIMECKPMTHIAFIVLNLGTAYSA